jgi:hypothetical protein
MAASLFSCWRFFFALFHFPPEKFDEPEPPRPPPLDLWSRSRGYLAKSLNHRWRNLRTNKTTRWSKNRQLLFLTGNEQVLRSGWTLPGPSNVVIALSWYRTITTKTGVPHAVFSYRMYQNKPPSPIRPPKNYYTSS